MNEPVQLQSQRLGHMPGLDGIRGVAILWVIFHNTMDMPLARADGALRLLSMLAHMGWIGVQLFFALSGFLITAGLIAARGTTHYFRDFYARRALRILPLYYLVLVLLLVVAPHVFPRQWALDTTGQASLWLFTINWTHTAPYGFAHFWSLAVEEQFYLFWPLVVYFCAPRRLLAVCLGLSVAALVMRVAMTAAGTDPWTLYTSTACRMDALALGAAVACLPDAPGVVAWMRRHSRYVLAGALALFALGIPVSSGYDRYRWPGETIGYTLLAICSATLVASVVFPHEHLGRRSFLSWAALRSIGKYSYAMYVFHGLLHKLLGEPWVLRSFGAHPPTSVVIVYSAVVMAVSYGLAYCSYHMFEKHFLRLKRRFSVPLRVRKES